MGIKDLWTILRPFGERKPLYELQGKTVAIDLSCWVCEAQNITEYTVQPRMYLRNLYFRSCYLLLLGVNPVFILEGNAPTLKYKTIAARNALQFKGKKPKTENTKRCRDRSRFNHTLKLCEEMLKYMGIVCVKGKGEAEAMCAYLNQKGFVDGCVTQDSDCFAYGAKMVYRNFSISQQGLQSANGGAIDEYNIEKLISNTGIGRFKIIALALICGSDYTDGVFGVGKDSVLKLFDGVSDADILNRLRSWKTNSEYYERLEKHLNNQNICSVCGHIGKLLLHNKDGCKLCHTIKECTAFGDTSKDKKIFRKNELNIRKKTLELPNFPDEELISEYLDNRESIHDLSVDWNQPKIVKFLQFTTKYLQWEEIYAFEKLFPILTRWHLIKYEKASINNDQDVITPNYIKKIRNPKGMASYEIIWLDVENLHKEIIPPEQLESVSYEKLLTSIEPQYLVEKAYPQLVEDFKASKIKPNKKVQRQKAPKTSKKKTKPTKCNLENVDANIEDEAKKQKSISMYFQKPSSNMGRSTNDSFQDMDESNFGDETDLDLSDIVDNIINYNKPGYISKTLQKLQNEEFESSFFMKLSTDADLFEQTFTNINYLSSSEESDSPE